MDPRLFLIWLSTYYFSVDAVVWLMEHMEEVDTEMKAIQVNRNKNVARIQNEGGETKHRNV